MDMVSPWIALAGGLLSLFSPCVLPVIPVYLASLAGPQVFEKTDARRQWRIFWNSLMFVAGFSIVFTGLGTLAGLTGSILNAHSALVRWISGGMMIVFGIFMLVSPHVSWLNYEKRLQASSSAASGYLRSFVLGLVFALAWTPCAGPILGGILSLALNSDTVWHGTLLLALYSLGAAIPFLLIGLAFRYLQPVISRLKKASTYFYLIGGILLIGVGVLILINKLNWLSF